MLFLTSLYILRRFLSSVLSDVTAKLAWAPYVSDYLPSLHLYSSSPPTGDGENRRRGDWRWPLLVAAALTGKDEWGEDWWPAERKCTLVSATSPSTTS